MTFNEYKSTLTVQAEQIEEDRSVITPMGNSRGLAGQWEVRYPDGNVQVVDDEQFQAEFGGDMPVQKEDKPSGVESGDGDTTSDRVRSPYTKKDSEEKGVKTPLTKDSDTE